MADSEVNTGLENSSAASVAVDTNPGSGSVKVRSAGRFWSRDDEGAYNRLERTLKEGVNNNVLTL